MFDESILHENKYLKKNQTWKAQLSLNKVTKQESERCSCATIAAPSETSTGNKTIRGDTEFGIGKAV